MRGAWSMTFGDQIVGELVHVVRLPVVALPVRVARVGCALERGVGHRCDEVRERATEACEAA